MAKVLFKRYETDAEAQASNIIDGQFIVTKEGTSYTDYGADRVAFGGTLDTQMSDSSINGVQNKVIKEYVDDGVQEVKDYVDGSILYNNATGANDNISLSDNLSNYSRIKIFSKIVLGGYTFSSINEYEVIIGSKISVNTARMNSATLWINDCATYILNSSSITKVNESDVRISEGGATAFNENTSRTLITKVIGYK